MPASDPSLAPRFLRHPRRLWLLISASCLIPALLDAFQRYMQGRISGQPASWRAVLWSGSEWLIFGLLTSITYFLGRALPLRRPHLARNLGVHTSAALALCMLWAFGGVTLSYALGTQWRDISRSRYLLSWTLTSLPWSVFMYFAVLGCVHAVSYLIEIREREAQTSRLAAQLAEARLGALRMQLHPHFLFNSLNAITVLVRDRDVAGAERMLELLSDALRDVLRGDQSDEVTLATELGFLERYLAIEQVRFSDRLRVTFDIAPALLAAAVPSWILQPLVENAVRHGFANRIGAGMLAIGARRDGADLVVTVRDDGHGIDPGVVGAEGAGVGLANTRERLRTMYGDAARLELERAESGGTVATVRVPYRELGASAARGGVA